MGTLLRFKDNRYREGGWGEREKANASKDGRKEVGERASGEKRRESEGEREEREKQRERRKKRERAEREGEREKDTLSPSLPTYRATSKQYTPGTPDGTEGERGRKRERRARARAIKRRTCLRGAVRLRQCRR